MKSLVPFRALLAGLLFAGAATFALANHEVTVTGDAMCAKCAMHETENCQGAIRVSVDGRMETYYLADNDVAKAFHKHICQSTVKVTATGTVETHDGKMILTASKIEPAST